MTSHLSLDLRYAWRSIRRRPLVAVGVVATLALAGALHATVFGVLDVTLLRPLPYVNEQSIVSIGTRWPETTQAGVSVPEYLDVLERSRTLDSVGAYTTDSFNLSAVDGGPEQLLTARVSASFFDVLGVHPALGRLFTADEDRPRVSSLVVLSHGVWLRHFGGRADVIGRTVRFESGPRQIIGVMPANFAFPSTDVDMWVPLTVNRAVPPPRSRHTHGMIARIGGGSNLESVRREMSALARSLEHEVPSVYPSGTVWDFTVRPIREQLTGSFRAPLQLLMAAVTLVMLMAVANVASLMFARASEREHEFATHRALGAPRSRLVLRSVVEGAGLGVVGGLTGVILGTNLLDAVRSLFPDGLQAPANLLSDTRTSLLTVGAATAAGAFAAATAAARASHPTRAFGLRTAWSSADPMATRVRAFLTTAQIAFAVMLLVSSGVALRSFVRLLNVDPGISVTAVTTARVAALNRFATRQDVVTYFDQLTASLSETPGVTNAGLVSLLPFAGGTNNVRFAVDGDTSTTRVPTPDEQLRVIGGAYFQAMSIPLMRGRFFDDRDRVDGQRVAIVSLTVARKYWGDQDPVGRRIRLHPDVPSEPWTTIVGVVGDVRNRGLDSGWVPMVYIPATQFPERVMTLVAQIDAGAIRNNGIIADAVHKVAPDQPVFATRDAQDWIARSVAAPKFNVVLLSLFGLLAMILATVGVYGVMALAVTQRTRELGIRLALGARPGSLVALVLGRSVSMTVIGIGVGLVTGQIVVTVFRSIFFEASRVDVVVLTVVPVLVLAAAVAASYLPSRRALRVDPVIALRSE
jgi:putative ABC transport system permease protein